MTDYTKQTKEKIVQLNNQLEEYPSTMELDKELEHLTNSFARDFGNIRFNDLEQKAFDRLMQEFDFEKVHRVMTHIDWDWCHTNGVPTVGDLMAATIDKFQALQIDPELVSICSGGLKLSRTSDDGEPILRLQFILEEWDEYIDTKISES
jgi:hypothetical protein